MGESIELANAVRSVLLGDDGAYLSAAQILERIDDSATLIRLCGSREKAVQRVNDVLLNGVKGELSFDFTPNGRKRDLLGSEVPEVTIVFRVRK